jgi:hypothetical protein
MNFKKVSTIILFMLGFGTLTLNSQTQPANSISGIVFDAITQAPLPYVNVWVPDKGNGTISNENGEFKLVTTELSSADSIWFQYLGYSTLKYKLADLDSSDLRIAMREQIINVSEMVVYASNPDVNKILIKVRENIPQNYRRTYQESEIFVRTRNSHKIKKIDTRFEKSTIPTFDRNRIQEIQEKLPREIITYHDILADLYLSGSEDDSVRQKVQARKAVLLENRNTDLAFMFIEEFNRALNESNEGEYWQMKSGIFNIEMSRPKDPSAEQEIENQTLRNLRYSLKSEMNFAFMENKDYWEFIFEPRRYRYEIVGGTMMQGVEVFIIDFTPLKKGKYKGRMYVASDTYAMIKADYALVDSNLGSDFKMLGVGYQEGAYHASVYYEKSDQGYALKYLSRNFGSDFQFNRSLSLKKKKDRFLIDKTIEEIKVDLNLDVQSDESVEILVFNRNPLTKEKFRLFKASPTVDLIQVSQFNDAAWKAYSIIEPTRQMKEYKIPN